MRTVMTTLSTIQNRHPDKHPTLLAPPPNTIHNRGIGAAERVPSTYVLSRRSLLGRVGGVPYPLISQERSRKVFPTYAYETSHPFVADLGQRVQCHHL